MNVIQANIELVRRGVRSTLDKAARVAALVDAALAAAPPPRSRAPSTPVANHHITFHLIISLLFFFFFFFRKLLMIYLAHSLISGCGSGSVGSGARDSVDGYDPGYCYSLWRQS